MKFMQAQARQNNGAASAERQQANAGESAPDAARRRTIRNLVIFTAATVGLPWTGYLLDVGGGTDPHDQESSLGWLLFLVTPLAVSLLLRAFGGERRGWADLGIKPNLRGNVRWYVFAFVFHPACLLLLLGAGAILGVTLVPDISAAKLALVGQSIMLILGPTVIKNIFEEFAWRGYLTPRTQQVVTNPLLGHALVGVIWFAWHLPYYLVLLSPAALRGYTTLGLEVFLPLSLLFCISASVVYGEVRLRTNSVWPAVLLHTGGNVFVDALVLQQAFSVQPGWAEALFAPALMSLGITFLYAVTGLWLLRERVQSGRPAPESRQLAAEKP